MEDKILLTLSETPGITTTEISRRLSASRVTVIQYLKKMKTRGIVYYRKAGPAKIWFVMDKSKRKVELAHARASAKGAEDKLESFLKDAFHLDLHEEEIEVLKKAKEILRKSGKEKK